MLFMVWFDNGNDVDVFKLNCRDRKFELLDLDKWDKKFEIIEISSFWELISKLI